MTLYFDLGNKTGVYDSSKQEKIKLNLSATTKLKAHDRLFNFLKLYPDLNKIVYEKVNSFRTGIGKGSFASTKFAVSYTRLESALISYATLNNIEIISHSNIKVAQMRNSKNIEKSDINDAYCLYLVDTQQK